MLSFTSLFGVLSLSIVASSYSIQQSPIILSSQVPQFSEIPLDYESSPSLTVSDSEEIAQSPGYMKEISLTDHLFPSFKKIGSAFSSGVSKINPFKKRSDESEENIQESPEAHEAPQVHDVFSKVASVGQAKLAEFASVNAKKLAKLIAVDDDKSTQFAAVKKDKIKQETSTLTKGKNDGPGTLVANFKVNHPIVGKQTGKIKLITN